MSVIVHSPKDVKPFLGKKIVRVSMTAYDVGLHFHQDQVMLIESHWVITDKNGQELDRGLGLKIRESSKIFILIDQTLRNIETVGSFLTLFFDLYQFRIITPGNVQGSGNLYRSSGYEKGSFQWDVFALTNPGYLLDKRKSKNVSIVRSQTLFKVQEALKAYGGQSIIRVSWSSEDISLYFIGHHMLLINHPWVLLDQEGKELDKSVALLERQNTALFQLLGHQLTSYEKNVDSLRIIFDGSLVLRIASVPFMGRRK